MIGAAPGAAPGRTLFRNLYGVLRTVLGGTPASLRSWALCAVYESTIMDVLCAEYFC